MTVSWPGNGRPVRQCRQGSDCRVLPQSPRTGLAGSRQPARARDPTRKPSGPSMSPEEPQALRSRSCHVRQKFWAQRLGFADKAVFLDHLTGAGQANRLSSRACESGALATAGGGHLDRGDFIERGSGTYPAFANECGSHDLVTCEQLGRPK